MKHKTENRNIIEKKETYQDKVMRLKKRKQSAKLDKITMRSGTLNQCFTKNIKKLLKNSDMAQALLSICLSGHPEQDVSKRR